MSGREDTIVYVRRRSPTTSPRAKRECLRPEADAPLVDPDEPVIQFIDTVADDADDPLIEGEGAALNMYTDKIPSLFPKFREHIAYKIWKNEERKPVRLHCHVAKLRKWAYKAGPGTRLFGHHFSASKLGKVLHISYKQVNVNLILAFIERWHPETNTFHMPFGEMTITLDDVWCLLGLDITGKAVASKRAGHPFQNTEIKNTDVARVLDVEQRVVDVGMSGEVRGSSVKLDWLRDTFMDGTTSQDPVEAERSARAYTLYLFGCALFPDRNGIRVNTHWLEYIKDMSTVGDYAWGAAVLAYLYRQMGRAARESPGSVGGYMTLLESWIYEHFPSLVVPPRNQAYRHGDPICARWAETAVAKPSEQRIAAYREAIDDLTPIQVVWQPYETVRDAFPLHDVSFFKGELLAHDIIEPYMPDRVLRQFGHVQGIPPKPITCRRLPQWRVDGGTSFILGDIWASWEAHVLPVDGRGQRVSYPCECSEDYMGWYISVSHPTVQNPEYRAGPSTLSTTQTEPIRAYISRSLRHSENPQVCGVAHSYYI